MPETTPKISISVLNKKLGSLIQEGMPEQEARLQKNPENTHLNSYTIAVSCKHILADDVADDDIALLPHKKPYPHKLLIKSAEGQIWDIAETNWHLGVL